MRTYLRAPAKAVLMTTISITLITFSHQAVQAHEITLSGSSSIRRDYDCPTPTPLMSAASMIHPSH